MKIVNGFKYASTTPYRQKKEYGSAAASTSHSITFDSVPIVGNMMFLYVNANPGTITTPAGWTVDITSTGGGDKFYAYRKIAGASEPQTVTFTVSASSDLVAQIYEWSPTYTLSDDGSSGTVNASTAITALTGTGVTTGPDLLIAAVVYEAFPISTVGPVAFDNGYVQLGYCKSISGVVLELYIAYKIEATSGTKSVNATASATCSTFSPWFLVSYK